MSLCQLKTVALTNHSYRSLSIKLKRYAKTSPKDVDLADR